MFAQIIKSITAKRFESNPLITFDSSAILGDNINGPSVIRVPQWIKNPLGHYYMYFAHHHGDYIRLAYADSPEGPWKIYGAGALHLSQTLAFTSHIASPDVHIDHDNMEIRMYYHGLSKENKQQLSSVAFSNNGIDFIDSGEILGYFYFRCWQYKGLWYAFAKKANSGHTVLYRSLCGKKDFVPVKELLPSARHTAVLPFGDYLIVFYSATGDAPERIKACIINMQDDCANWECSESFEIIKPQGKIEGANFPVEPSNIGSKTAVNQLRDPCIFVDDEQIYLYYSYAGEEGISGAEISINHKP